MGVRAKALLGRPIPRSSSQRSIRPWKEAQLPQCTHYREGRQHTKVLTTMCDCQHLFPSHNNVLHPCYYCIRGAKAVLTS
jgi:hypothetical protein